MSYCILPGPREPFKRNTVDLAPRAIALAGGVFSLYKSDTAFPPFPPWAEFVIRITFPAGPQKKKIDIASLGFTNAGTDALEGHTLTLLVRFYRKVRFVVLVTGVHV